MKLATDLLPYLDQNADWFEHELVKKAKQFIGLSQTDEMLAHTLTKIQEQIDIEKKSAEPDKYLITKLTQLIQTHSKVA